MRVLLTSEARFERTPDGAVWGPPACGGEVWARYLEVFSAVLVAARVWDVQEPSPASLQASSPGVDFCALSPYSGLSGFARHAGALRRRVAEAVRSVPAVIVRSPSPVAFLACRAAAGAGRRYAAEVVGDPGGVFSPGAFQHPLRSPIRHLAIAAQKHIARHALAVLYVTNEALQRRYPTAGRPYAASDVVLDDMAFASRPPRACRVSEPFVIVTVAALDQPYKGIAVLLDAFRTLRGHGRPLKLRVVGDGRLKAQLQQQAAEQGTSADIEFLGQQDRAGVFAALDSAHLFALPSLTEGLPRALLEAMARGLPAIATDVGGIPELLTAECLVPPRDPAALVTRIERLIVDDPHRCYLGERNRRRALLYHERAQRGVRRDFLHAVMSASASKVVEACCA